MARGTKKDDYVGPFDGANMKTSEAGDFEEKFSRPKFTNKNREKGSMNYSPGFLQHTIKDNCK